MKISAMLSRRKGRDFYDVMFLLAQTQPNCSFLAEKLNIHNLEELKTVMTQTLKKVDLNVKKRDFEHLLFNKRNSERILSVGEYFQDLKLRVIIFLYRLIVLPFLLRKQLLKDSNESF